MDYSISNSSNQIILPFTPLILQTTSVLNTPIRCLKARTFRLTTQRQQPLLQGPHGPSPIPHLPSTSLPTPYRWSS